MPLQGFTRFRKHQVGKQTSFGSNTAATRVLPFRGPIKINPSRTDPDVDTGSIDPVLARYNGPLEITSSWDGPLSYNDLPYVLSGGLKGGVTPTGATAKTWTYQAASLTADDFEYFTDEWGDDATTDTIIAGSGIVDSFDMSFGDQLGPFQLSAALVYARARHGSGPTGGLTVDSDPTWIYGDDSEFFLDTVAASIGTTKWTDTVHSIGLSVNGNNDRKRFANGSNTRFQLAAYGRGARTGELKVTVAKTTASIAEADTLQTDPVPTRFLEVRTTSPVIITGVIPYSYSLRVAAELTDREDGEIGGNSTITLTYAIKYNATLGYAYRAVVVNTLASL